jgi:GMP synthase (glutamine-hydrolysing)
MKDTFACGVSSFGSCWALQIAAVALGGKVELNPKGREVGIGRKVSMTPEGRAHPMFAGKKSVFECFMSHG